MEKSSLSLDVAQLAPQIRRAGQLWVDGRVTRVVGIMAEAYIDGAAIGDLCSIVTPRGRVPAEVAGFSDQRVLLMPLGDLRGVAAGAQVIRRGQTGSVVVDAALLGRVIDGFARPLDGLPLSISGSSRPLYASPLSPLERRPVQSPLFFGIRAIDGLLTCGEGQRMGILAGPGVGKTVLLSMIAQRAACDVLVLALIGERGREVGDFIRSFAGTPTAQRMIVVASTSDRPPLERMRAAFLATTIAEHFRDEGKAVLLVMDSLTRVAMAQREVGLAIGEPPTTKGYTPSVFAKLPQLLERAGARMDSGSITGLYTVLMEGDDLTDPVADAAMAILDGQLVLSRRLAGMGHYPAIDVMRSISRVMPSITEAAHQQAEKRVREILTLLADNEDLINIGAYQRGQNPRLDEALSRKEDLTAFLRQGMTDMTPPQQTLQWLSKLGAALVGGRS